MKKNDRKAKTLKLNRETLAHLDAPDLTKAQGGTDDKCTGCPSGCGIYYNAALD